MAEGAGGFAQKENTQTFACTDAVGTAEDAADLATFKLSDAAHENIADSPFKDFTLNSVDGRLTVKCHRAIVGRNSRVLK